MISELESTYNGWDRTFLDLSSKMAEPFCKAWELCRYRLVAPLDPSKFENCASRIEEVATRAVIGLGIAFGTFICTSFPLSALSTVALLGVGSKVFRAIGFMLQKGGFTHVRGEALEKILDPNDPKLKIATYNFCAVGGGMSLDHGGVIPWRSRIPAIIEKIRSDDADIIAIQENYDADFGEKLIKELKREYAHFFIHLGPNVMGSVGGCMILTKCAISSFSHISFENNQWTLNRGFGVLEVKTSPQDVSPCLRFIGTHLIHGEEPNDQKNRMGQVAQIVNHVALQKLNLPTILAGDLNIERDQKEGDELSKFLRHAYLGSEPTCTNRLAAQWDLKKRSVWEETIDYISLFKRVLLDKNYLPVVDEGIVFEDCYLSKSFDNAYNTKTAISDHHGIVCSIRGLKTL